MSMLISILLLVKISLFLFLARNFFTLLRVFGLFLNDPEFEIDAECEFTFELEFEFEYFLLL